MSGVAVLRLSGRGACSQCLARHAPAFASRTLHRSSIHTKRKLHGAIIPDENVQKNMTIQPQPSFQDYFSSNTTIDRGWLKNGLLATWRTAAEKPKVYPPVQTPSSEQPQTSETMEEAVQINAQNSVVPTQATILPSSQTLRKDESLPVSGTSSQEHILPHRRRRRREENTNSSDQQEEQLPLDASSQLTTAAAALPSSATIRRKFATYLSLTKPRLSFLIILTTASAYSLYPIPDILSSATTAADASSALSTSTLTLAYLTVGTFMSSACANTLNMLFEPKYDALMTRTRNRPLVRKLISRRAAFLFAFVCGASGILLLDVGTNPTVAALSALNIFLYAGVYTPMKRMSPINTWVGAIVGGIPPLMGWCAAAGEVATSEHHEWKDLLLSENAVGGWLLAALLFAWQFPHFNSLSHTIRQDYRNAGHKMLAWMNPAMNARVALRYSVAMFPICAGLYYVGVVNQGFLVISTACNIWMTKEAVKFWQKQGASGSARGLFWASVWQLPLVLVGALVCKTGIWDGFFGQSEEVHSIYEESPSSAKEDGMGLGMDEPLTKKLTHPHTWNMAMLGFKRPS